MNASTLLRGALAAIAFAAACGAALRDALQRLALAARDAGGRAVVGIVSTYNGNTIDDPAQVECRLGQSKVLVPLSGVIARAVPASAAAR